MCARLLMLSRLITAYGLRTGLICAQERQDYGPLVQLAGQLFPNASDRSRLFWDTPNRLFKFADH